MLPPHGALNETLLIFPWFIEEFVTLPSDRWCGNATQTLPAVHFQDSDDYASGGESEFGKISPFDVFDTILDLLQANLVSVLPNVQSIDIVGYSGGCKIASRWAFFSPHAMSQSRRARVRTTAGGCAHYLYLDSTRPDSSCLSAEGHGPGDACWKFSKPTSFADSEEGCPKSNVIDKGLGEVPENHSYVQHILGNKETLSKTIDDFPKKHVLFMVGSEDACNCLDQDKYKNPTYCFHPFKFFCNDVYPDYVAWASTTGVVGGSCAKNLQGWSRAQRASNYMGHLEDFYSKRGVEFTPLHAVHEGAHCYACMLKKPDFQKFLGFATV